ncbi:isoaspartyl peptidase/L-asparaginase family protein [Ferrimonas marina]|uniref:Isoaspartyl peptidase n=1 Tax=Ferrimonas marina TaxID=299255 RepID=A0A1M5YUU6_9GAMM|nr:isoaspartyl peptidase/L-asparaginase [Ferrimonas marina]SHI15719.1 beta-aspartyl-peptidase (threonine type) [Ferrimonas marina]
MKKLWIAGLLALIGVVGITAAWYGNRQVNPIAFAIHAGAGTIDPQAMDDATQEAVITTLDRALAAGYTHLQSGGDALGAVARAVVILEDSPLFNAGVGAVYTFEGGHELDASIMSGRDRQAGAVASVTRVKNPILAAQAVMNDSPHVMLSGEGADQFAREQGLEWVDNDHFNTPHRRQSLERAKAKLMAQASVDQLPLDQRSGTVGAVALDRNGDLAAATSTGGMTAKRWGRIGDSPIIGAGTFADNQSCAVSATGHGEFFIRYNVAADICARVRYLDEPLSKAADWVIGRELKGVGGDGGVIAVAPNGEVAMPFNTPGMYRAAIDGEGNKVIAIWQAPLVERQLNR